MADVRRAITDINFSGYRGRSVELVLSCGHRTHCKLSQKPKYRAVCRDCTHLKRGGQISINGVPQRWEDFACL